MVVGHWTSNDILIRYIYSFHMPALFIISGYLYKPRPWIKSILSFGIPVAFYSLLNLVFLLEILFDFDSIIDTPIVEAPKSIVFISSFPHS